VIYHLGITGKEYNISGNLCRLPQTSCLNRLSDSFKDFTLDKLSSKQAFETYYK